MLNNKIIIMNKLKAGSSGILIFCINFMLLTSCTSVNITPDVNLNEQIKAENRIMKKNLTLAVRENSVLKDENIQYKGENSRLNARVKLLESEIESVKKKYDHDIALLNEKYESLNKKNIILGEESSSKIQELSALNKSIEEKMTGEITKLNEIIRKQEEKFNNDRASIETAFSSKELEYQKQLAQIKKDLLTSTMEMESLKSKLAESEANLADAKADIQRREKLSNDLVKKIESLITENEKKKNTQPEIKTGNP